MGREHRPGMGFAHTVIGSGCGDKHSMSQRGDGKSSGWRAHTVSCLVRPREERRQRRSSQSGIKPVKLI